MHELVTGVWPRVIFRCILIQTLHANRGKTSQTEQQRSPGLKQVHPGVFTAAGSRMSSFLPQTSSQSWRRFWYFKSLIWFLHGSSWPPPSLGVLPHPPLVRLHRPHDTYQRRRIIAVIVLLLLFFQCVCGSSSTISVLNGSRRSSREADGLLIWITSC